MRKFLMKKVKLTMRIKKLPALIFLLVIICSCSAELYSPNLLITGNSGYNFVQSQKEWNKLKRRYKESYTYTIFEQSHTGSGSETTIVVKNGEVISREYEYFTVSEDDGTREVTNSFYEEKEELSSHPEGWAPVKMDDLYRDCGAKYLKVDPETHTLYFDTNDEGVIILCGNVPDLCADDCFQGFTISRFEWLK